MRRIEDQIHGIAKTIENDEYRIDASNEASAAIARLVRP